MRWTEKQLAEHLDRTGIPAPLKHAAVGSQPFRPPLDIVVDLPPPISVNRIWRKTKTGVIKSDAYRKWVQRADDMLVEFGQSKRVQPLAGKFTALIVVRRSNLDLDNNAKCVLDFMQSRNFVVNDKLCEELSMRWGDAPTGCRVTIRPFA